MREPGRDNNDDQGDKPAGRQRDPNPQGGKPDSGGPPGSGGGNRLSRGLFGWVMILVLIAALTVVFQNISSSGQRLQTWSEFVNLYQEDALKPPVKITSDRIIAVRKAGPDGPERQVYYPIPSRAHEFYLQRLDNLTGGDFQDAGGTPWWQVIFFSPLLLTILLIAVFWFIISRGLRSAGAGGGVLGNFGRSRHRVLAKESTGVTFADVAGVEEAKDEVEEIIEFLKNPKKFTRLGGRIPRGVLLVGQPGTGKTLLAKAIAGEADVPFFSISGSDFVEMFVGVGASRVRDLFKQAKENSPCIIFLDEIDAVGRRRGGGFTTGGHDEREQTLNAILVEMDGFETDDQVIVIAATNRSDVLDPALTRPGRFDRQVIVPLPDLKGRLEILRVHSRKVKIGPDVDLEKIARGTPMFSGAELAAIVNESAIIATMADKDCIEHTDLEEARDKIRYGRARKSHVVEEQERRATAYHEAGHAVLQVLVPGADPLHKVTIIPRGQTGGATFSLPEKDRYGYNLKWLRAMMRIVCGGRIAEERETSDVSSGAAMDIQQLTTMARAMVLEWGMSEKLGFVRYAGTDQRDAFVHDRDYSEETARIIDEEIRHYADEAYHEARTILDANWDQVVAVADALLKHETLTAEEVKKLMAGEKLDKPSVSDLLAAEAAKARDEADRASKPKPKPTPDEDLGPGMLPSPA